MDPKQTPPNAFGPFVPGFDFLQKLAQGGNASFQQWVAPTMDPEALDKRIGELRAVHFWLEQNTAALKATLQALEVQKMTLATLQSMNAMPGKAAAGAAKKAATPDPLQYWNALTQQFQTIATSAMQDVAARAAAAQSATARQATASAPADAAPAKKAAPRRRKTP
ncbi:MAG: hypothetical protein O9318_12665 [Hylemonella sp.]|uniref:PhaM family polyhydroxyalkanoate granule multifunctional regulatory protein n=1 Tax=Hylemonella sp. TaxID=2066020 RepID=UPI0022C0997B|nr:PhaM family polyhydroxyalkanoate granule multifunctional regulatory protein [Hylemonella sp.]MCZ8253316.1 hypothetical protein [Hylemonella sp.]